MNNTLLSLVLIIICIALSTESPARNNQHFAAPYSGKKVQSYTISLPTERRKRKSFGVPGDCTELVKLYRHGAFQWGSRVERSLWSKVNTDCRFHNFLNRFPLKPKNDFVSQYDFYNADFNDLPIKQSCNVLTDGSDCISMPDGIRSLSTFIPFLKSDTYDSEKLSDQCRFNNGLFRGRLLLTPGGLRCQPDIKAPGCRVLSIDHADVNGDSYQDVILKLIPLGRATTRAPLILPLTRTAEDQKFRIPNGVKLPDIQN